MVSTKCRINTVYTLVSSVDIVLCKPSILINVFLFRWLIMGGLLVIKHQCHLGLFELGYPHHVFTWAKWLSCGRQKESSLKLAVVLEIFHIAMICLI